MSKGNNNEKDTELKSSEDFRSPDEFAEEIKESWNKEEKKVQRSIEETIERRARKKAADILEKESQELKKTAV